MNQIDIEDVVWLLGEKDKTILALKAQLRQAEALLAQLQQPIKPNEKIMEPKQF